MSNGAKEASGVAIYRMVRELGSRSPSSYAAIREPNELVVLTKLVRATGPKAKASRATFIAADGSISLGSETITELAREARCLAKNWHPNIARVRHVDTHDDDLSVATDLVDGVTLADLLAAAKAARPAGSGEPFLPLPIVVRILVDVLAGLSGLHSLRDGTSLPFGVIHGAVCPANIVVGKDGVARLVNSLRPRPVRIGATSEGVSYAAPEALDIDGTSDARSDIHAVGVILWEALAGRRLYVDADPARILATQRSEEVPAPKLPQGSPFARLADVALRALAFDRSLRFKSAPEMTSAIRNVVGTRIATGSVVAGLVAELVGDRIRARRGELDPSSTSGTRLRASERAMKAAVVPVVTIDLPPPSNRVTFNPAMLDPREVAPPSERIEIQAHEIEEPSTILRPPPRPAIPPAPPAMPSAATRAEPARKPPPPPPSKPAASKPAVPKTLAPGPAPVVLAPIVPAPIATAPIAPVGIAAPIAPAAIVEAAPSEPKNAPSAIEAPAVDQLVLVTPKTTVSNEVVSDAVAEAPAPVPPPPPDPERQSPTVLSVRPPLADPRRRRFMPLLAACAILLMLFGSAYAVRAIFADDEQRATTNAKVVPGGTTATATTTAIVTPTATTEATTEATPTTSAAVTATPEPSAPVATAIATATATATAAATATATATATAEPANASAEANKTPAPTPVAAPTHITPPAPEPPKAPQPPRGKKSTYEPLGI
jgi:serine/threonine-protein kinase